MDCATVLLPDYSLFKGIKCAPSATLRAQIQCLTLTNQAGTIAFLLEGVVPCPFAGSVGRNGYGGGNALVDAPGRDPGVGGATSLTAGEAGADKGTCHHKGNTSLLAQTHTELLGDMTTV